jgi:mevalonate kinase
MIILFNCMDISVLPLEHRTNIDALLDALHSVRIAHGTKTDEQTCSVFLFLVSIFCAQQNAFHGVTVRVSTELPLSSGLGSSAAYSVSLAQGFWHLLKCGFASTFPVMHKPSHADLVLINHWAFECERMMHGNPSGVDNTVSTFGGALAFRRGMDPIVLSQVHSLRLLVVNTKQTRDTKKLVGGVGTRLAKHELVMQPILDAMHHIALSVAQLIAPAHSTEVIKLAYAPNAPGAASNAASQDSYADLVELFSMNQALLNGIGVGHAVLDRVCDVARAAGFPGAKLTGAGGGGCALVLLPSDQHTNSTALIQALEAEGIQAARFLFDSNFSVTSLYQL